MSRSSRFALRIAFVDHSSSPGGGQLGLLRYLRQPSRHARALYLLEPGELAERASEAGAPVVIGSPGGSPWAAARRLHARILDDGVDAVVLNSRRAAHLFGALRGSPNVSYLAYLREDLSRASFRPGRRLVSTRLLLPRLDGLIANSRWTASTVPRSLRRLPLEVAYPVSGVTQRKRRTRRGDAAAPLRLLSLSRLEPWKGVHVVLESIGMLRPEVRARLRVTIAGASHFSGDGYRERLERMVRDRGLPVRFIGHVDDVTDLLRSHDALVHASVRPEPFGQVVAQGLSARMLTIATRGGGPSELIHDGVDGVLVPPGDPEALAATIERAIRDPAWAAQLGDVAARNAARLADEVTASGLDSAIQRLCVSTRR